MCTLSHSIWIWVAVKFVWRDHLWRDHSSQIPKNVFPSDTFVLALFLSLSMGGLSGQVLPVHGNLTMSLPCIVNKFAFIFGSIWPGEHSSSHFLVVLNLKLNKYYYLIKWMIIISHSMPYKKNIINHKHIIP